MLLTSLLDFTGDYVSLVIKIQTEHAMYDALKDNRSPLEQFHIPFHKNIMERKWSFHILRYLHFCSNINLPDKSGNDCAGFENLIFLL
jgi:hypothetical protein